MKKYNEKVYHDNILFQFSTLIK